MSSIIDDAAVDLCRSDSRETLGDEHEQCQHLFTKVYTLMRERQKELTDNLLCCSRVHDPVIELRYYKSKVKRSQNSKNPQFIESETGADFALALRIDLPGILRIERSVLGQAKVLDKKSTPINEDQLETILSVGGAESATFIIWGTHTSPVVISADNIASFCQTQNTMRLNSSVLPLGKPLSEFFCDAFISLWFGKSYDPEKEGDKPPSSSIPVLYHFLHRGNPPPNVVYFGIMSGRRLNIPPGVYVHDRVDIPD